MAMIYRIIDFDDPTHFVSKMITCTHFIGIRSHIFITIVTLMYVNIFMGLKHFKHGVWTCVLINVNPGWPFPVWLARTKPEQRMRTCDTVEQSKNKVRIKQNRKK